MVFSAENGPGLRRKTGDSVTDWRARRGDSPSGRSASDGSLHQSATEAHAHHDLDVPGKQSARASWLNHCQRVINCASRCARRAGRRGLGIVLFMQQVLKNVGHSPNFGRFFIARRRGLSSVRSATEGGSPSRPVRGSGSNRRPKYRGERQRFGRATGTKGDLPGVRCTRRRRDPSTGQNMEVTMKMVKSLLLGGAAGLVAVAGAQAADLPVKAKPVEYVKICSLYGEGFFYIPGTDTCLKIGGWGRGDQYFGNTGGRGSPFIPGGAGRNDSFDSNDYGTRARTVVSFDVRTQTEYGVLRSYARFGVDLTTNQQNAGGLRTERAFVQFAGFTFGKTQSYFDIWAHAWSYGAFAIAGGADTSAEARNLVAYTATLGNGFSWTIAAEETTQRSSKIGRAHV